MGRLTQRNVRENIMPNLGAAAVGSGQFGSRRQAQVTGNALRDIQSDLLGKQMQALQQGYTTAGTQAQTDLSRALQAGQAFENLGQAQQGMGLAGLKTMSDYGAQQQAQGQKLLDYPMAQTQQFAKLLQGYQMPMGTTTQSTGSEGYSNSPLSQIAGLGSLVAASLLLLPPPAYRLTISRQERRWRYAQGSRRWCASCRWRDGSFWRRISRWQRKLLRCRWLLSGVKNGTSNKPFGASIRRTKQTSCPSTSRR